MSENKAAIRVRPRPYDLRRKVLLKNFLKEQMTYLPVTRRSSSSTEEEELIEDSTNSENDENMRSIDEVEEGSSEPSSVSAESDLDSASLIVPENVDSTEDSSESNSNTVDTEVKPNESRFSRFSKMIKRKIGQRKRRGLTKAKHTYKNLKPITCISDKRKDFASSIKRKKSILSMFRPKTNSVDTSADSSNILPQRTEEITGESSTSTTSNQSCQTDLTWSQDEFNNLEQSNKDLREENRLLSESLSTMISNTTFSLNPKKPYGTDSYTSTNNNPQPLPIETNASEANPPVKPQRTKPASPKTVNLLPGYLTRSKSMYHSKRLVDSNPRLISARSAFTNRRYPFTFNSSAANKSSVLKNLSINNPTRTIVRRASMPERPSCETVRPLLRTRSNSIQPNFTSNPHMLSFPYINGQHKPIVRRTSMPERRGISSRPFLRHRQSNCHEYSSAKTAVQGRYRSKFGAQSQPVSFKNLPSNAFY